MSKGELPSGWSCVPLAELTQLENGDRSKNYPSKRYRLSTGVPFINAGNLKDGRVCTEAMEYISEERFELLSSGKIQDDDVLFCLRGSLGKTALVSDIAEGAIASSLVIVRARGSLLPRYLYYYLSSPLAKSEIARFDNGTAQPNLAARDLGRFLIPVAPLSEQGRIVEAVEEEFTRVDAGLGALMRARQNVKRFRAAHLRDKLSNDEAPRVSINDIATSIQYGYTAKATASPVGPRMLRITDIQDGAVNWDTVPHCRIDEAGINKFRLSPGDLVFARTGATVGKSYLIGADVPVAVFASYLIRLRFCEAVLPAYIALFFQSQEYWYQIAAGSLGIGQPNVNATTLGRVTVRLPSTQEQARTVEAMSELDRELFLITATLNSQTRRGQLLKSSILADAFCAHLVAHDPTDEPASVLLERIAADSSSSNGHKVTRGRRTRALRERGTA